MKITKEMEQKRFQFFKCKQCQKDYPAKNENPQSKCLFCLQCRHKNQDHRTDPLTLNLIKFCIECGIEIKKEK